MADIKVCGNCSYSWIKGEDGSHRCDQIMNVAIKKLEAQVKQLKEHRGISEMCIGTARLLAHNKASHSEIAQSLKYYSNKLDELDAPAPSIEESKEV